VGGVRHHTGRVDFLGSFARDLPVPGLPEIAFVGRSNVGKSSALNTLLRRKAIARVSGTPGRTQLVNLFDLGGKLVFADLPGYGFAKVPDAVRDAWKPMIEGYLGSRDDLKLVVVLVDVRREPQEMDGAMLWALTEARIPSLCVATKCDKLSKQQLSKQLGAIRREFRLPADQPVAFSALDGRGFDAVWDVIERVAGLTPPGESGAPDRAQPT
jgi:GTP-binding protein